MKLIVQKSERENSQLMLIMGKLSRMHATSLVSPW